MSKKERDINIITLGETGVGKTSILNRLRDDTFHENEKSSQLISIFHQQRPYEKRKLIMKLNFRDTGGQEIYLESLPKQYMRDSHVVLLIFSDIKNLNVLIDRWYKHYKDNTNIDNSRFILVGNKSDIFGEEKQTIEKQGQEFADEINAHFITCSAKSKDNMDILEQIIVNEAKGLIDLTEELLNEQNKIQQNNQNFNLDERKNENKKSGCC